jgi:hypothetical protein
MLSTKRGKSSEKVRKELFAITPYANVCNKSENKSEFQCLGQTLKQLNLKYHALSLDEEFMLNSNAREKQAIALVISRLNQSEDIHSSIEYTYNSDERLKIEFQEKEKLLRLEYKDKLDDALNCSICLENKKSRTTIPCGHSYCLPCSKTLLKRKTCAQCRCKIETIIPLFL